MLTGFFSPVLWSSYLFKLVKNNAYSIVMLAVSAPIAKILIIFIPISAMSLVISKVFTYLEYFASQLESPSFITVFTTLIYFS